MISTIDEARRYLLNLLPPGHQDLYDETTTGDIYLLFDAAGEFFKSKGFDLLATLQRELFPPSAVAKLPDWEAATGIAGYLVALFGSTPQRQQSLVGKLRESGPFCDPVVGSIFAALFGYLPATPVEILKCSRADLRAAHSYGPIADTVINPGDTAVIPIFVRDGGHVALMGAQLDLNFSVGDLTGYTVTLEGPDGTSVTWANNWQAVPFRLASLDFAGKPIFGTWTLSVHNGGGVANTLFGDPLLFVEGIGVHQDTGGAIFHWGVYADPAHLGETGAPADFQATRFAIQRIKHSHTVGRMIQSLSPWPDVTSGLHASIPDESIPV